MKLSRKQQNKKVMLGLGLDASDGHKRTTNTKDFHIVGGSKETHEQMQEKAIKFNEELKRRGKTLQQTSTNEIKDIADKIDMPLF